MIYFIRSGDWVKIGRSNNPEKRLQELQTSNPIKLHIMFRMDAPNHYEALIHEHLREYRGVREWFEFKPVKAFLQSGHHLCKPVIYTSKNRLFGMTENYLNLNFQLCGTDNGWPSFRYYAAESKLYINEAAKKIIQLDNKFVESGFTPE